LKFHEINQRLVSNSNIQFFGHKYLKPTFNCSANLDLTLFECKLCHSSGAKQLSWLLATVLQHILKHRSYI